MHNKRPNKFGKVSGWFIWILAVLLLVSSGITYRLLESRLQLLVGTPINLPVPLGSLPKEIGKWTGNDIPIPKSIQIVAGNDDFINRLYVKKSDNKWVNVYLAYTAQPRTMLGHRPEVCYIGRGWIHDGTEVTEIISDSSRKIPCLIQRFHMPNPDYEERVVLNFYIVNGQFVTNQNFFSGLKWRIPNTKRDPARYVAQVQISSILENSVRTAAQEMLEQILVFFPDEDGRVRATERGKFENSGTQTTLNFISKN